MTREKGYTEIEHYGNYKLKRKEYFSANMNCLYLIILYNNKNLACENQIVTATTKDLTDMRGINYYS